MLLIAKNMGSNKENNMVSEEDIAAIRKGEKRPWQV